MWGGVQRLLPGAAGQAVPLPHLPEGALVRHPALELEGGETTIKAIRLLAPGSATSFKVSGMAAPWSAGNIHRPCAPEPRPKGRPARKIRDTKDDPAICLTCTKVSCDYGTCPAVDGSGSRKPWRGGRGIKLPEDLDRERMALYNQGLSDKEMADALGLCRDAIRKWRKQRGLENRAACGAGTPQTAGSTNKRIG